MLKQKSIIEENEDDTNPAQLQANSVNIPEKIEEKKEDFPKTEPVNVRDDAEAVRHGPSDSVVSTGSVLSDGDTVLRAPEVQLEVVKRNEFRMSELPPIPDDDWMMDVFSTKPELNKGSDKEQEKELVQDNGMYNPFDGEEFEDKESRKGKEETYHQKLNLNHVT